MSSCSQHNLVIPHEVNRQKHPTFINPQSPPAGAPLWAVDTLGSSCSSGKVIAEPATGDKDEEKGAC